MNIQIEPIKLNRFDTFEVDNVRLIQGGYVLGSNSQPCKVKVEFFSGVDKKDDSTRVDIPNELIESWTDDESLIYYVINELGLVKVEENTDI